MPDATDPSCPPPALQLAIAAFRRIAFSALFAGDSPSLTALAASVSDDATDVNEAIAWLEVRGALERDGDRLVGAHGLTHRPTAHALTIGGRALHTWCAFDAVAIPVALAATATATTTCPTCGRQLVVDVHDGRPPAGGNLVLWLPGGECRNVLADFCAHANLFCNRDHLDTWRRSAGDPAGRSVTLAEVPALACAEWADVADVA